MDLIAKLKPGVNVEFIVKDENNKEIRLRTLIERGFDGETFSVMAPVSEGMNYPMHAGERFKMLFTLLDDMNTKLAYSMKVEIVDRYKNEDMTLVKVRQISAPSREQRRESFRLSILKTFKYERNGVSKDVLIKNLSATGLRGIVHERIPAESELKMHLILADGSPMVVDSKVISCNPVPDSIKQYDLRLNFHNLKEADRTKLMNFIFTKQSEGIRKTSSVEGFSNLFQQIYGYATNKRSGDDWRVRSIPIFALVSWFLTICISTLLLQAMPEERYGLDEFWSYARRTRWDETLLYIAAGLAIIQLIVSSMGLLVNSTRLKREGDRWSPSLLINVVVPIIALFFIFLYALQLGQAT